MISLILLLKSSFEIFFRDEGGGHKICAPYFCYGGSQGMCIFPVLAVTVPGARSRDFTFALGFTVSDIARPICKMDGSITVGEEKS